MGRQVDGESIDQATIDRHRKAEILKKLSLWKVDDGSDDYSQDSVYSSEKVEEPSSKKRNWQWIKRKSSGKAIPNFMSVESEEPVVEYEEPVPPREVFDNRMQQFDHGYGDDVGLEERYYTFQTDLSKKPASIANKCVEEDLWDERKDVGFFNFWNMQTDKLPTKKKKKKNLESFGLYDDDANMKHMPMVNNFERNNGQWWDETNRKENPEQAAPNYEPHTLCSPFDDPPVVQRRRERTVKPNGEHHEVIVEQFVTNTNRQRNNRTGLEKASDGIGYTQRDYDDAVRKRRFDQKVREYQYYVNGVTIPTPRKPREMAPPEEERSIPTRSARNGPPIWQMANTNRNSQILTFHRQVRAFLRLVPIFCHVEPSLAALEATIPKDVKTNNRTSGVALIICLLDITICTAAAYWCIKIYVFFSKVFKRVFWIFDTVGLL